MKIEDSAIRTRTEDEWAMIVRLEDSEVNFVLFSWDVNRLNFDPEEVTGYTVQEALDRCRAKAALLMQEDALIINTN